MLCLPNWLRANDRELSNLSMAPHSDSTLGHKARNATMLGMKDFTGLGLTGLASDSRKVKPGYLFAALAGNKNEGAEFLLEAGTRCAAAVRGEPAMADPGEALGAGLIAD